MQWDDLRVFLAVAQAGSLRKAARALRLGQPTVGRHLRALERSVGARLFERTPDGHRLTREGETLLPMAQSMADAAAAIDRRRAGFGADGGGAVRVVAGEWVARFLAPRLSSLADTHDDLSISLAESHLDPDLERREADLFIRHGLPARGRLVRMSLGTMTAAIYGARSFVGAHPDAGTDARWRRCAWVAYDARHEYFRSMAWLAQRLGDRVPRVRASRIALQLEAIPAGAGLGILPCFVGDVDPGLVRLTAPIEELRGDYWLLVHPDLKGVPRVRRVTEWIRGVFKASRPTLEGIATRRTMPG
ncbi:MAG: LysR family transcriptional regulator [Candidatus Rokubacteria bacterium]|nr:LysR family transcriptional regulator [Candidatus Rokubacteria bacterium]